MVVYSFFLYSVTLVWFVSNVNWFSAWLIQICQFSSEWIPGQFKDHLGVGNVFENIGIEVIKHYQVSKLLFLNIYNAFHVKDEFFSKRLHDYYIFMSDKCWL
jgi:hypothetical protein